jgi:hypothetical protein
MASPCWPPPGPPHPATRSSLDTPSRPADPLEKPAGDEPGGKLPGCRKLGPPRPPRAVPSGLAAPVFGGKTRQKSCSPARYGGPLPVAGFRETKTTAANLKSLVAASSRWDPRFLDPVGGLGRIPASGPACGRSRWSHRRGGGRLQTPHELRQSRCRSAWETAATGGQNRLPALLAAGRPDWAKVPSAAPPY